MSNVETKSCPFCGEEVKVKAIKCKHCHSNLDENSVKAVKIAIAKNIPTDLKATKQSSEERDSREVDPSASNAFIDIKKWYSLAGRIIVGAVVVVLLYVMVANLFNGLYSERPDDINDEIGIKEVQGLNNPFSSENITLRDIVAKQDEFYYVTEPIVIGPVHITGNDIDRRMFQVRGSMGTGYIDYDADVFFEVYYGASVNETECLGVISRDRPIAFMEGELVRYSNTRKPYFYAYEVAFVVESTR